MIITNRKNAPLAAQWIKDKRTEAGLTLRDIEKKVDGITYSHMSRIENGTRRIPLDRVDDLCDVMGAPRHELRALVLTEDMSADDQLKVAEAILRRLGLTLAISATATPELAA